MGCLITRSSVELKLLLSCHRRGEGEGELDVNKETVELKDYSGHHSTYLWTCLIRAYLAAKLGWMDGWMGK